MSFLRLITLVLVFLPYITHALVNLAVTDVFLGAASNMDAAIEACDKIYHGSLVGSNWGEINGSTVAHLCQRRQRLDDIEPGQRVLQKIGVYGATECPPAMELFFQPKTFRVVCLQWETSTMVHCSGNYISDLWVSTQRNYNNDDVGWTNLPLSVFTPATGLLERIRQRYSTPSFQGAFISFKRPILPIREVRVVQRNSTQHFMSSCSTTLGSSWEDTSEAHPIHSHGASRTLCVRRGNEPIEPALLALRVTTYVESCLGLYNQTEPLGNGVHLCLMYGNPHIGMSPIVSIRVDALKHCDNTETEVKPHVCTARKDAPAALPYDPIDRPPLVANSATARTLTFKILQLADLHLTGDPTTRCRDAPEEFGSMRCTEALTTKYVNELLDLEKPDFVVFSGDNVETVESSLRQVAMDAATEGVEARKIPYAMIFGNHDDENGFSREMMVKMAMAKSYSYTQCGPAEVFGVGNYELNIKAPVDGPWGDAGPHVLSRLESVSGQEQALSCRHHIRLDPPKPSRVLPANVSSTPGRHGPRGHVLPHPVARVRHGRLVTSDWGASRTGDFLESALGLVLHIGGDW